MKFDVHGHETRYKNWKEEVVKLGQEGLTRKNNDVLLQYIFDMEVGANVSIKNKKGPRSYAQLNNLRQRIAYIMNKLQEKGINDITKVTEKEITLFFNDLGNGTIKTFRGRKYESAGDYVKIFKAFWRWWMKVNRKEGKAIPDITEDLGTSKAEPRFVSISKEEIDKMLPYFNENEQVILMFVFDSLIRSPTELMSLEGRDVFKREGEVWVNIRKEISKTIGRTLNLLYCGEALLKYIERNEIKPDGYLFRFSYPVFTEKIQQVAKQVFGNKISEGGEYYKNITIYDLRHSGAIHLRVIAHKTKKINLDALRQRGGWTDFKMLNYYTKFLGLTGEIDKNDLLVDQDKSRLEKEISELKSENIAQQEKVRELASEIKKLWGMSGKIRYVKLLLEAADKNKIIKKEFGKYIDGLPPEELVYPIVSKNNYAERNKKEETQA